MSRSFNLAEKLALIYTSAGSQQAIANQIGVSRSTIGRILHKAFDGLPTDHYDANKLLQRKVERAFQKHITISRAKAQAHEIPFRAELPIYLERLPLRNQAVLDKSGKKLFWGSPENVKRFVAGKKVTFEDTNKLTGEIRKREYQLPKDQIGKTQTIKLLGDRVAALHMHWISEKLRNAWIKLQQKTGKYYAATIGSLVGLRPYNKQANERAKEALKKRKYRNVEQLKAQTKFAKVVKGSDTSALQRVYTNKFSMDPQQDPNHIIANIRDRLQHRHEPAAIVPGAKVADRVILQVDTIKERRNAQTKKR